MIETKNQTSSTSRADRSDKTLILVTTAMMTAMVMIATTFFKIPNAMGYIHLGDGLRATRSDHLAKEIRLFRWRCWGWASRHLWVVMPFGHLGHW